MGESMADFQARRQRERNGSLTMASAASTGELFDMDRLRLNEGREGTDVGIGLRNLYTAATNPTPVEDKRSLFNFSNPFKGNLGTIATALTEPLVNFGEIDLPGENFDFLNAPLNLGRQGVEELSSPIGLALLPFAPTLGATSVLGRLGVKMAADALAGGAAIGASSWVNTNLPENTPGALRLIANLGVGAIAGLSIDQGLRAAVKSSATAKQLAAIDLTNKPLVHKLGANLANVDELIDMQSSARLHFQNVQFKAFDNELERSLRTGADPDQALANAIGSMKGNALREADDAIKDAIGGAGFTKADTDWFYSEVIKHDQAFKGINIPDPTRPRGSRSFDTPAAHRALVNLFEEGVVPTDSEWRAFSDVFGPQVEAIVRETQKTTGQKVIDGLLEAANVPRAIAASMDMSAPLRQGIMLVGHPQRFVKSFGRMVKAGFADEAYAGGRIDYLTERMRTTNVDITDFREGMSGHEEQFLSRFIHNIPGLGELTKRSERSYTLFLNELRAGVYEDVARGWGTSGTPSMLGLRQTGGAMPTTADHDALGQMVNFMTGRGSAKALEGNLGRVLSASFFSPKFFLSRLQAPALMIGRGPAVRRQVAREMGIAFGTGMSVLGLLSVTAGATVEMDPRSSDFGKGKVGNTRFDFWGGYQQIFRHFAQITTGQATAVGTGNTFDIERDEALWRFTRSKFSPPVGFGFDWLGGETFIGEELQPDIETFSQEMFARTAPLFMQDALEAFQASGLEIGAAASLGSFFGVGSTSFNSTADLLAEHGLDVAEPHERLRILAEKPEVAEELMRRNEISKDRGNEAATRRVNQVEIQEEFRVRHEAADSLMLSMNLTPGQWRDQYKLFNAEQRGSYDALFRDFEGQGDNAVSRYGAAIETSQDAIGNVDWDQVDVWMASQPAEDQAFIERNTGLRDTELRQTYKADLTDLDAAAFFDIKDEVWEQAMRSLPGAEQYNSYDDWLLANRNRLTRTLTAQGMDPRVADQEAERMLRSHGISKFVGDYTNNLQQHWIQANPRLAAVAAGWDLLNLQIAERQFISAALR